MRSGGFGPSFQFIYVEWLRPFFSLLITAILFHACAFGESKTLNEAELSKLLRKAENGSLSAQVQVAKAYASGRAAGKTDYEQAARWYRNAADQGDPDSQTNLATLYLLGQGVARSDAEAVRWLQRAAASAYLIAQHNLAIMYFRGWGVAADPEHGVELLMRSAKAGLEISQLHLGAAYMNGEGVPRNPELAIKWLTRAARHDLPAADFVLGIAYENGEGTHADPARAAEYYRKAATNGYAPAQNNLGRLYLAGMGVRKDSQEAARLFSEAAQQGNGPSYLNLALCSLIACSRVVDVPAAYSWYLAAKTSRVTVPQLFVDTFTELASEMTEEQLKHAELASQNWIAQHPTADPRSPIELHRLPGTTLAVDRQTGTAINDEVLKTLWQQTPFMQPRLPSRDFGR